MTLFTGLIFLNMSFFLAEVSALKLDKNKEMAENIAKLIAGAASEEEKDIFGSSAEKDTQNTSNEVDLFINGHQSTDSNLLLLTSSLGVHNQDKTIHHYSEITYPPPKG